MSDNTPVRAKRLRVAHLVIQPVLVWDDGEELTDGPQVQPVSLPLSQVPGLLERMPGEVANLEAQALASPETDVPPDPSA